jgi:hypothetical protein
MKAVILQSGYLPWLGYFDMIAQADVFVFLDDVQWTTRDWRNRNRIRTPQGWKWLTVPVRLEKPYYEYSIKDVAIDYSRNWQSQHLATLQHCYRKAPYFDEVYPLFENILVRKPKFIVDLNYELVFGICHYIGLKETRFLFSQKMNIPGELKKDEKLLGILGEIGGITTYISGPAARSYLDAGKLEKEGIEVAWHDYNHPYYHQNTWGSNIFIPYLSTVDLLFNHGKDSLEILSGEKIIEKPECIRVMLPEDYKKEVVT